MIFPEHIRAWLYRVCLAVIALAAGYGLVDGAKVQLWQALVTVLFPIGLAAANTSTHRE